VRSELSIGSSVVAGDELRSFPRQLRLFHNDVMYIEIIAWFYALLSPVFSNLTFEPDMRFRFISLQEQLKVMHS